MAMSERLASLQVKHAQLERELDEEFQRPMPNTETVARLKRAKLRLKDEMAQMSA
ncbi:MAG: YdcH family protein [Rhodospirillaceae bacterium]|nr:YdcH family protein [Rhodospirillaceae bacterium]